MSDRVLHAQAVRHRAYRRAYELDLWNHAGARIPPARLALAEHRELWALFREAWSRRDLGETVRIGEALQAKDGLRPVDLARFRSTLARLGRSRDAPGAGAERAATPQDLLALAAAGHRAEARAQMSGVDAASDPQTMALLDRAVGHDGGPEAWDAETGPVAAALDLGCGDLAANLAAEALDRAVPEADHFPAALELLEASFRLAGPTAARRLLDALEPMFAPADLPAWRAVARLADASPDDGPVMAAAADDTRRFALAYLLTSACAAIGRPDAAIRRLSRFSHLDLKNAEHLAELARLVGAAERLSPRYAERSGPRRIFDVFPFNGEFALLDLKLAAMADWVHLFVLVEAPRTFTNKPKPLYFQEAADRYAAYADKIVHVITEDPPAFVDSAWTREYHQRDQGVRGLSGLCAPDDLVLISDVDEIVDPAALEGFCEPFATLGMRSFQFFLNYERVGDPRQERKVGVVEARMLQAAGLSGLRVGMWSYSKRRVPDAGWHFSSVLTAEDIELKTLSYSHEEHQEAGAAAAYARMIEEVRGGHRHPGFARVPIDSTFPRALQGSPAAFARFILPEAGS